MIIINKIQEEVEVGEGEEEEMVPIMVVEEVNNNNMVTSENKKIKIKYFIKKINDI